MATQLATTDSRVPTAETQHFELQQRQARMFATSPLVPEHLRKGSPEQAMANCYIALKLAEIMGEAPLIVMQNIHIVQGKAGFDAKYMIARANKSGVFEGRINWRVDTSDSKNMSVQAFATLADTGEEVNFTCDMAMANAEGWSRNSKYKTMPEVMLRYRSATFLIRFYAADVMLGYHTAEEMQDVASAGAIDVGGNGGVSKAMLLEQASDDEAEYEPAETATPENPTAAEGPADEDRGEQSAPDKADLLKRIAAAPTVIDLGDINSEFQAHKDWSDEDFTAIDEALTERAKFLRKPKEAN